LRRHRVPPEDGPDGRRRHRVAELEELAADPLVVGYEYSLGEEHWRVRSPDVPRLGVSPRLLAPPAHARPLPGRPGGDGCTPGAPARSPRPAPASKAAREAAAGPPAPDGAEPLRAPRPVVALPRPSRDPAPLAPRGGAPEVDGLRPASWPWSPTAGSGGT